MSRRQPGPDGADSCCDLRLCPALGPQRDVGFRYVPSRPLEEMLDLERCSGEERQPVEGPVRQQLWLAWNGNWAGTALAKPVSGNA